MEQFIQSFASLGSLVVGCLIIALAGGLGMFAGGCLGDNISTRIFDRGGMTGVNIGCPWGLWCSMAWACLCLYYGSMSVAFLASLGLAAVLFLLSALVWAATDPNSAG